MTTVIFVRHGQSKCNLSRHFAGRIDTGLTELGLAQAQCVANALRDYPVMRIYSSPLSRAVKTARPTADLFGLDILPEPGLYEIAAGDWEGLSYEEIEAKYPVEYDHLHNDLSLFEPPNGEPMRHLFDRVTVCVERLVAENRGKCIALFSHYMPLRSMLCKWNGIPFSDIQQAPSGKNASITVAEYDDDLIPHILREADNSHLAGLSATPIWPV